jgi:thymidine phosphorylase
MLAAAMLALGEILDGKKPEQPAVVEQSVGGDGDPIDLVLDPDDPRLTVAFVKPWLAGR